MERRRFSRIPFQAEAEVTLLGNTYNATLLDLSLKGILLNLPQSILVEPQSQIKVAFQLPQSDVAIAIDTVLVKQTDHQLHCKVTQIDVDSLSHIKRLIELNLADEALLEREIGQLIEA
jgi:hypothetical protein